MPTFPAFRTKPYYDALKTWLLESHNEDGTLKSSAVQAEVAAAIAAEPTVVQAAADAVDANPTIADHETRISGNEAAAARVDPTSTGSANQFLVYDSDVARMGWFNHPVLVSSFAPYKIQAGSVAGTAARVQSFLDALSTTGIPGVLLPGTYELDEEVDPGYGLVHAESNTMLYGYGATLKRVYLPTPEIGVTRSVFGIHREWLEDQTVENVTIMGLEVDANRAAMEAAGGYTDTVYHALNIVGGSNITLADLNLHDAFGDGLHISGTMGAPSGTADLEPHGIRGYNLDCHDNRRQGMSITSGYDMAFYASRFRGSSGAAPQAGVDLEPNMATEQLHSIEFHGCEFTGNAGGGLLITEWDGATARQGEIKVFGGRMDGNNYGLEIYRGGSVQVFGASASDNTVDGVNSFTNHTNDLLLVGMTIKRNGRYGVGCADNTTTNANERWTLRDMVIEDNTSHGITLRYVNDLRINGGRIRNNGAFGIVGVETVTDWEFADIHIEGNTYGAIYDRMSRTGRWRRWNITGAGVDVESAAWNVGKGTATVAAGSTSVTVTHGVNDTPQAQEITVLPTNNLGAATKWWVSGITSTQFVINVDVAPGGSGATFAWQVETR